MKELKAVSLLILALATFYLSSVYVARMWYNIGTLEIAMVLFVFYAVWNVKRTFEL